MEMVLLLSVFISFSSALQYQTLLLNDDVDLSRPQTRSRADNNSISGELVHRDEHLHFDPTMTRQAIFANRLQRDLHRVPLLAARSSSSPGANSSVFSGKAQGSDEYFTRLGVGTPPKYVNLIVDTGSDVSWLQCKPCQGCYDQSDAIFNPKASETYNNIPCDSRRCLELDNSVCSSRKNSCQYEISYGDGSFTTGDLSTETLTLRENEVKSITIGCGHDNEGLFQGADGVLGLGRGKLSFPNQAIRYGRLFSYCLVGRFSKDKSYILFGEASVSRKARFTPMLRNRHSSIASTYYYVNLTGISVSGVRVPGITHRVSKIDKKGNGGVIIDSGTVITRLEESAYVALRNAFRLGASKLKQAPGVLFLDTCYDLSRMENASVPTVVLHFDGRADMKLPGENCLVEVDDQKTFCFAFAPIKGISIIGNNQQLGFRVVYDLKAERIGFASNSC